MVGPNGFEPSTSSVSRKRSRPTELRAYMRTGCEFNSNGRRAITAMSHFRPKQRHGAADRETSSVGSTLQSLNAVVSNGVHRHFQKLAHQLAASLASETTGRRSRR